MPDTSTTSVPGRNKIKFLFHKFRIEVILIHIIHDKIDLLETQSSNHSNGIKTFENFINNYEIDVMEMTDTSFHSTVCQNCSEVCHENCEPDEITLVNDQLIHQCWVIKNSNCRQCTGKCTTTVHYYINKTIQKTKKKLQNIVDEITSKSNQTSIKKTLSKDDARTALENALQQMIQHINVVCIKLHHVYPDYNLTEELQICIDQLEKECTLLKSTNAKKQGIAFAFKLKDLMNIIKNDPKLLEKRFVSETINQADQTDQNNSNEKQLNVWFGRQLMHIACDELKELLLDELLVDWQLLNLCTSEILLISTPLIRISNKIKLLFHKVRIEVNLIHVVHDKIDTMEIQSINRNNNTSAYQDFVAKHEIDVVEMIDTSFHNTVCQNCSEVCHENCESDEITIINDQAFHQCWMIKNGNCRQCTNKCISTVHYYTNKTIQKTKRKLQDILRDINGKYNQVFDTNILLNDDGRKILETALQQIIQHIKLLAIKLYYIYPDYDLTQELQVFIDQMEKECTMLKNSNTKKQGITFTFELKDLMNIIKNDPKLLEKSLIQMITKQTEQSEKTQMKTELHKTVTNLKKIQQSTIFDNYNETNVSVKKLVTDQHTSTSSISSESKQATITGRQEILDTSHMAKILIIGETGSGKSTFINYLTNYFYHGDLKKLRVAIPSKFHPHVTENFVYCENDLHDTTQSKTDSCNQYMFSVDSKPYLFIDTPGLSDTRGPQQDDKNINKIIDSVEALGSLTAVIIVVNGAVSRLTINLRNVLTRLRGNLPDIVMENVIVVLTNVTRYSYSFSIDALELNGNVYPYFMQNSAFSQDPTRWTPRTFEAIQYEFNRSMTQIKHMLYTIDTFQTKSVVAFKTMKDIRNEIKTLLHTARLEVSQIQKLQDEIAVCESLVKQCDNHLVTYKDYTKEREIDVTEIVDAPFHSTLCRQCNQICHENCQLDESTMIGAQILYQCWAIKDGNCRECTGNCSYIFHYHAKKTIKQSKKKIQNILSEIKTKYDETHQEKNTHQQKIISKEDARKLLENALKQKDDEIKQLCLKLRGICTGFDLTQELHVLIDQLETEESMLRSIEAKQQANVLIRSLKDLCHRMTNDADFMMKTSRKMNIINTELSTDSQPHLISVNSTESHPFDMSVPDKVKSSSAPNSHTNDDVLAIIRAMNGKETTKNTSNNKVDAMMEPKVNESISDSESDDDREQNLVSKKGSHKLLPTIKDSEDLQSLSIPELIDCYNSYKGQSQANLIIFELVQRSLGKSIGPMKTPEAIAQFIASSQKYGLSRVNELKKEYGILTRCIHLITGSDIFKISQVPSNILSDIAAVYMLLQRQSTEDDPSSNIPSYPSQYTTLKEYSQSTPSRMDSKYERSLAPKVNQQEYSSALIASSHFYSPIPFSTNENSAIHYKQADTHPGSARPPDYPPSTDLQNMRQSPVSTDSLKNASSSSNRQAHANRSSRSSNKSAYTGGKDNEREPETDQ